MSDESDNQEHLETLNSLLNNYNNKQKSQLTSPSQPTSAKLSDSVMKRSISLYSKKSATPKKDHEKFHSDGSASHDEDDDDDLDEIKNNDETNDNNYDNEDSNDDTNDTNDESRNYSFEKNNQIPLDSEPESELSIDLPDYLPPVQSKQFHNQPSTQPHNSIPTQQSTPPSPSQSPTQPPTLPPTQLLTQPPTRNQPNYPPTQLNYFQSNQYNQSNQQNEEEIFQQPNYKVTRKSVPGEDYGITSLTVITFNIWYHKKNHVTRTKHLLKLLINGGKSMPDIICFQEVTTKSFQIIQQTLPPHYFLFEVFGDPPLPYTNVTAINRDTLDIIEDTLTAYDFESQMGRKLLVCQLRVKKTDTKFYLLNTHLESYEDNWKYRKTQMESIYRLIKGDKITNFILAGDFNVYCDQEPVETQLRLYEYQDAWIEMGSPQSLKYTYDTETNPYANNKGGLLQSRLDRILYRFKEDKVVVTKMKLLGTKEPFPSDHCGVLAQFMVKSTKI